MDSIGFSEKELKLAVAEYAADLGSMELGGRPDNIFSDGFEARMKRILAGAVGPRRRRRILRHLAAIAAALIIVFAGVMAVSPEARAVVRDWIIRVFRDYVEYEFFPSERTEQKLEVWNAGWIPEGFTLTETRELGSERILYYKNEAGDSFEIAYLDKAAVRSVIVEKSGDKVHSEKVSIGSLKGEFYYATEHYSGCELVWVDDLRGRVFVIAADSVLSRDDLIRIAESFTAEQ